MKAALFHLLCIALIAGGIVYLLGRPEPPPRPRYGFLGEMGRVRLRPGVTRAVIRAGGRNVAIEVRVPPDRGRGRRPGVLLIQDSREPLGAGGERVQGWLRDLAGAGMVTMIADYAPVDEEYRGNVLAELRRRLRRIEGVDRGRVAVVGMGDGSPIALAVASLEPGLASLVLWSPRLARGFGLEGAERLPPTLLVVGEEDAASVATLNALEATFRDLGRPYDVFLAKGVGGEGLLAPGPAAREAWARTLAHLRAGLGPGG